MIKISKSLALLAVVVTAIILFSGAGQAQSVRTIHNDGGGVVKDYVIRANLAILRGQRMRIDGWCASACTAYLGNPNTCVTPSAQFGFHGPSGGSAAQNRRAAQTLARQLPRVLQGWYLTQAAQLQGRAHIQVSAGQLVQMGAARWCQS